jgi:spore photoproduct lyase
VVIGFSMNTPHAIALLEQGTAMLEERLEAIKLCEEMGFWIAFHFDPMVWYPGWEKDYRMVVDRIFSTMKNPEKIAWWSLGGFRTMPSLKQRLRGYGRHLPLFSGEMVLGRDKKNRYFRPVRTAFYRVMRHAVTSYYPECTLYLCMESREIWTEAGMIHAIPRGLVRYLDERAEKMLT